MTTYLYNLCCPDTEEIRYIGKSNDPQKRLRRHIQSSRNPQNYAQRWMAKLLREGKKPILKVVREIQDFENWQEIEILAIAEGFAKGLRLTNTSAGGEGVLLLNAEDEARRLASTRAAWQSPELRARHSEIQKTSQNRPELIEGNRRRMLQRWANPDWKDACLKALKEGADRPGVKEKRSANTRRLWTEENFRQRMMDMLKAHKADPAVRQRISAAMKIARADPAVKEKWTAAHTTSEVKAKQSASRIAFWQTEEGRAKMMATYTPERRAHQAALIADPERKSKIDAARNSPEYKAKRAATIRAKTKARKDAMAPEEVAAKEEAHREKERARSKANYAAKRLASKALPQPAT